MITLRGNFFDFANLEVKPKTQFHCALVCTTNMQLNKRGSLVMGAGIAKAFAEKYHYLAVQWGYRLAKGIHCHGVMASPEFAVISSGDWNDSVTADYNLVAFPTKDHWKNPSSLELIKQSMRIVRGIADVMHWRSILMPPPGCGNGGLKWEDVQAAISPWADDRFHVVLPKNER